MYACLFIHSDSHSPTENERKRNNGVKSCYGRCLHLMKMTFSFIKLKQSSLPCSIYVIIPGHNESEGKKIAIVFHDYHPHHVKCIIILCYYATHKNVHTHNMHKQKIRIIFIFILLENFKFKTCLSFFFSLFVFCCILVHGNVQKNDFHVDFYTFL